MNFQAKKNGYVKCDATEMCDVNFHGKKNNYVKILAENGYVKFHTKRNDYVKF